MYINFTSIKKTTTKKEDTETETGAELRGERRRVSVPGGPPCSPGSSRPGPPCAPRQLQPPHGFSRAQPQRPPHWGGPLPISLVSTERSSPGLKCFKEVFTGKDEAARHASQNFVVSSACTDTSRKGVPALHSFHQGTQAGPIALVW